MSGEQASSPSTSARWPEWSYAARQSPETSVAEYSFDNPPEGPSLLPNVEEISDERLRELREQRPEEAAARNLS